ncbi:MAG TPA: phosphoglucomutase/phosphomannomutase family protein [Dehalococcoidia bacterium]|nr:phosphoglucomutase/phosphomannomutase family protein [Dehalococcoidia bacterium]
MAPSPHRTLIRFGTDGWRAIIADEYTFENVRYCAEGVASYLHSAGLASRGLVVGYDTRFASEDFAAAAADVIAARGIDVWLFDRPAPTPVACHAVLRKGTGGAVVITASHNPGRYNGFKYKTEAGGSAPPEVIARIEAGLDEAQIRAYGALKLEEGLAGRGAGVVAEGAPAAEGKVVTFDPLPEYEESLRGLVDLQTLREAGLTVVYDAMHAAGAGILARLLDGGRTGVIEIRGERNPAFPGMTSPEPIARNLSALAERVVSERAAVGLANDGDADRLGVIDEHGRFVDQLQTYALLCYYLLEYRGLRAPLVRSLTSTRMVDKLGRLYGVDVHETPVGFKFLGPKMTEVGAMAAGEESGGYAFSGHIPERDGVYSGLLFLDLIARSGKWPSELVRELYSKVGQHFYDRIDVHLDPATRDAAVARVAEAEPTRLAGIEVVSKDTVDGFRFELGDKGWVLVRPSGTEPLLRIYTETTEKGLVEPLLQAAKALAGL